MTSTPVLLPNSGLRIRSRALPVLTLSTAAVLAIAATLLGTAGSANAATAPVGLGTAGSYSVLAGSTVTNTGPSRLAANLGVSPGTALTGFPPGQVDGTKHAADANAAQAQAALTTAWNDAAGRAKTASVSGDLVGKTLTAGVYKSTSTLALSGTVTLNAQGNRNAVFIFQVASTLITASASKVAMINGAQACHVYWQIGSSATLGTTSVFRGTLMALTSISVTTGTTVEGRALARNGAVTLDDDTFITPGCKTGGLASSSPATTSPGTGGSSGSSPGTGGSSTGNGTGTGGGGTGSGNATNPAGQGTGTGHGTSTSTRSSSHVVGGPSGPHDNGQSGGTGTPIANTGPSIPVRYLLIIAAGLIAVGLTLSRTTPRRPRHRH